MIAKKFRISTRRVPEAIRGKSIHTPLFRAVLRNSWDTYPHIAVIVSKKLAKTAVMRNSLRRKFYSAVRPQLMKVSKPITVAFFPKEESKTVDMPNLAREIEKLNLFS